MPTVTWTTENEADLRKAVNYLKKPIVTPKRMALILHGAYTNQMLPTLKITESSVLSKCNEVFNLCCRNFEYNDYGNAMADQDRSILEGLVWESIEIVIQLTDSKNLEIKNTANVDRQRMIDHWNYMLDKEREYATVKGS